MAAPRVILSKAKSCGGWGYGLRGKLGLLGGSRSILDRNSILRSRFLSVNQSCRHYFLPPPPPQTILELSGPRCCSHCPVAPDTDHVLSLAEYAVECHNKTRGGDLRFVRVVRVSVSGCPGINWYYMTLEAFDKKAGELNVYYAVVYRCPSKNIQLLKSWKPVDESFHYPFEEFSVGERWRKTRLLSEEGNKNRIIVAWLDALGPPYADYADLDPILSERITDPLRPILDFEKKSMPNTDGRQPGPPENASDPGATVASDFVATIYDNFVYENIYRLASRAVQEHNKTEDDEIHLEEVLWASKSNAEKGAHYFLLA